MPFTPYHMGFGVLIKTLMQGGFSLIIFGWTQVAMDIQPLIALLSGEGRLHGFSHTYLGATLIALVSAVTGRYIVKLGFLIFRLNQTVKPVTWFVSLLSALIGSFSHVFLDSMV